MRACGNAACRATQRVGGSRLPSARHFLTWRTGVVASVSPTRSGDSWDEERYDLVDVEGIEMSRYLWLCRDTRRVFGEHNVEYLLQQRATLSSPPSRRWPKALYSFDPGAQAGELRGVRLARRLTARSRCPPRRRSAGAPRSSGTYRVVPNAIDTAAYPAREPGGERPSLLFTGTLDSDQMVDAVEWLVGGRVSRIRAACSEARLFVVGRSPYPRLVGRGKQDRSLVVTGPVESLAPYWRRAAVVRAPDAGGRRRAVQGARGDGRGVPIVSTSLGMEGIGATPDVHYLAADSAMRSRARFKRLLADEAARRCARAARPSARRRTIRLARGCPAAARRLRELVLSSRATVAWRLSSSWRCSAQSSVPMCDLEQSRSGRPPWMVALASCLTARPVQMANDVPVSPRVS